MKKAIIVTFVFALVAMASCKSRSFHAEDENNASVRAQFSSGGFSASEREELYHLSEGDEVYPLDWVRALNDENGRPLVESFEALGLVPSPSRRAGENYKYIGLSFTEQVDVKTTMMGINCAACHNGKVEYKGKSLIVDGAPNMFDIVTFFVKINQAFSRTLSNKTELTAALKRYWALRYKGAYNPSAGDGLKFVDELKTMFELMNAYLDDVSKSDKRAAVDAQFAAVLKAIPGAEKPALKAMYQEQVALYDKVFKSIMANPDLFRARLEYMQFRPSGNPKPAVAYTHGGYGRSDAFGSARNRLFPYSPVNLDAPVKFPHVWGLKSHRYVHWNSNSNSIVERNVGQSIGLGAIVDVKTGNSTVNLKNLMRFEELAYKLESPRWPDFFPKIDAAKAERGKAIYGNSCAKCHDNVKTKDGLNEYVEVPVEKIKTDANQAKNFGTPITMPGGRVSTFPAELARVLTQVKNTYYTKHQVPTTQQRAWEQVDRRAPIEWRVNNKYTARPLAGVWAIAPYLHNGSVPNLYELLLPAAKRSKSFPVGHREFDPIRVGYVSQISQVRGGVRFTLDTTQSGSSNAGHEGELYGTNLSEEQRYDLIEYLKTL